MLKSLEYPHGFWLILTSSRHCKLLWCAAAPTSLSALPSSWPSLESAWVFQYLYHLYHSKSKASRTLLKVDHIKKYLRNLKKITEIHGKSIDIQALSQVQLWKCIQSLSFVRIKLPRKAWRQGYWDHEPLLIVARLFPNTKYRRSSCVLHINEISNMLSWKKPYFQMIFTYQ